MKAILKDGFFSIFNKACYFGIRLLIIFFYSKASADNKFATFIYVVNLVEIGRLLIDFGIDTVYIRTLSLADPAEEKRILNIIFNLKIGMGLIGYVVVMLISFCTLGLSNIPIVALSGLILPLAANSLFIGVYFQAKGKNMLLSPFWAGASLLNLGLIFCIGNKEWLYGEYLFSELSFLLAGILAIRIYFPFSMRPKFSLSSIKSVYTETKFAGISQAITTFYGKTDIVFIEKLSQRLYVAEYGFFNRITDPFFMISSALSTAAYSFFSKRIDVLHPDEFWKKAKMLLLYSAFYAVTIALVIIFLIPFLLHVFGSKYNMSLSIALGFGIATFLRVFNGVITSLYFTLGMYNFTFRLSILNIALLVAAYFLFIPSLQLQGVLLSIVIAEFVSLLIKCFYLKRSISR